ncbi:MAG: PfkB family carbohydrate kinase [Mycobacterium sp.]|nr:PfkB family carbohydrate kinase [Mycobacterium sp.]
MVDAAAGTHRAVPVSAVSVVESTGDRLGCLAGRGDLRRRHRRRWARLIKDADVVLVDGHHPLIARDAARHAAARAVALVVDAGRWKPVMTDIIPHATDMVCSNDFRVPGADGPDSHRRGVGARRCPHSLSPRTAASPVRWWSDGRSGSVPVPRVTVLDTLGAGDAFHGAYSYYLAQSASGITERIDRSARVAALRCSIVGPRAWLDQLPGDLYTAQTRKREW